MMQILIVDDQSAMRQALELLFDVHGFSALVAATPEEALEAIRREDVGVVIQDMNFAEGETSGQGGIALFRAIRELDAELPVLLMTAWTSLETAVELVKEGAADYFAKPWNDDKLLATVGRLLRMRELARDNQRLHARGVQARRQLAQQYDLCGLVYASFAMHELVSLAARVAASDAPVLITGPNGAGKELVAEIVHKNSRRANKPFVKVNAGALPDQLLEAELFGAEAGAYTGASKARIGRFEAAHGGTLLLDELGNLSLNGQMKLLRVLQSGEFERLGSNTTRKVDVRLVSATNADLPRAIAAGTFREDLMFRLNVIELKFPPLCERSEDIPALAEHFLSRLTRAAGSPTPYRLSAQAAQALLDYEWPGNVRELENRLQRASLLCRDGLISPDDLGISSQIPAAARTRASSSAPATRRDDPDGAPPQTDTERARSERPRDLSASEADERQLLQEALTRNGGVVAKAAAECGLSRQAFYRRMERLGVVLERRVRD